MVRDYIDNFAYIMELYSYTDIITPSSTYGCTEQILRSSTPPLLLNCRNHRKATTRGRDHNIAPGRCDTASRRPPQHVHD